MDRFRTLPSVILNTDRTPLKRAEELAIVIGLAAARLRQNLDTQEETLYATVRRTAMAVAVLVLVLAVLGAWWMLNNGQSAALPYLIVGALIVLALVGIAFVFAPYMKRFRVGGDQAAVTRVSRLYYPVGILPLGEERAIVWDALTEKGSPLAVVDLPPTMGLEQETIAATATKPDTALTALIAYQAELQSIAPEAIAWPADNPDTSTQQVGEEAADLWKRMSLLMSGDPHAVLGLNASTGVEAWRAIADEGERIHTFHQEIESLRLLTERYKQRAEHMVDSARELSEAYGASVTQQVADARSTHFNGTGATNPGDYLPLNVGNTAEQIQGNLNQMQSALTPLDEQIQAEWATLTRAEATALGAVENSHIPHREELAQQERNIAQVDSEILKLAASLDMYQQRINEGRTALLAGFEKVAQMPMASLRSEMQSLESSVVNAATTIDGVTPRMDLPSLDSTMNALTQALNAAHQTWSKLASDLPKRGSDVTTRLETIQSSLKKVTETEQSPEAKQVTDALNSVKSVERVARDMVSWTTSQQDPLSPIEDHDQELNTHVVTLRELRRQLEQAAATFHTASSAKSPDLGLPLVLQRVEQALGEFIRQADENSAAAAALNNAAETVTKQSLRIEQLLQERDQLRVAYEQQAATLLEQIQSERTAVNTEYAAKRKQIETRRAGLNRVHDGVTRRVERTLANPAFQSTGVMQDTQQIPWSDLMVRQMNQAVDEWGKRVAGIEGDNKNSPVVQQMRDQIEACYQAINDRSVGTELTAEDHPLSPHICFVPFWFVETEQAPKSDQGNGRMVHVFPPLHLDRPSPTEMPDIESLRYREVTRRLLAFLRRDFVNGGDPATALSFHPAVLTDAAKAIPDQAGAPMWQELATALAQHWVFFRSDDAQLNRIVLNSRDHLLPAEQIVEAWMQNAQQPALPDDERGQLSG